MNSLLRLKASKNFERYLNDYLQRGGTIGLPMERLTELEWAKLNEELKPLGVVLVLRKHRDGNMYYFFTRYEKETNSVDKTKVFNQGTQNVFNYLLSEIRNKYPNIPDNAIIKMIQTGGRDAELIYEQLRYRQDGKYTGTSEQDLEQAFIYALQSSGNKNELIDMAGIHYWEPWKYANTNVLNMSVRGNWPDDRKIKMWGTQDWTWFRKCDGKTLSPVRDSNNRDGFHISLNVNLNEKLLKILDDILIEDGGQYIDSYKFPKTKYYTDVVLRHDPVTIYTNARNAELERKIARAVQPFVRSNDGLIGEMLGAGVSISPETSSSGVSVGKKISIDIANFISKYKDRL